MNIGPRFKYYLGSQFGRCLSTRVKPQVKAIMVIKHNTDRVKKAQEPGATALNMIARMSGLRNSLLVTQQDSHRLPSHIQVPVTH